VKPNTPGTVHGPGWSAPGTVLRVVNTGGTLGELALRFDHTVPLARFVSAHINEIGLPFKRFAIGSVFRGERPAKGRFREFTQCDFDIVGTESTVADAEIVLVIHQALTHAEVPRSTIWLNHRGLLEALLDSAAARDRGPAVLRALDKLGKIGRDNVAANWSDLLDPVRETIAKGTTDKNCDVRAAAIDQVAMVWEWVPGRDIFTVERNTLAAWKGGMLQLVQPFLKDAEIPARLAAMRTLSALPIDLAAAPALELLNDKEPFVRAELIRYFAPRTGLIPDEQLLGLLYNSEPMVRASAELALKSRGLNDIQISLGKMIVSPDPLVRSSVIGKLDESMDVDAGVWLARLVEDKDAAVRLKAVEAIAKRKVSGDLIRRLQVISEKDTSDAVRKSAEKVVRAQSNASLASPLPPLPKTDRQPAAAKAAGSVIRAN
jgi:HEAT repeat protein